jgi:hypothetical protein
MRYNFEKKKQEEVPDKHNVMRLRVPETPIVWRESSTKPEGFLAKLAKIFTAADSPKREQVYVLYELLSLRAKWMSSEQNDIQRFVYMFPSNPNPLLSLVANRCLVHSTFSSETDRKMVTKTLEALMNLEFQFCAITHLFIGSCMLTSDKTVRSFAAEVWIKAVTGKQEMSKEVGEVIGIHLTGGYAPLKRLTELLSTNLMKISRQHNTALEVMLTSIIEKLPIEAPVGTKRLLELYLETIGINQSSATSMELKNRLASWNGSAGLKKVIDSIMKSNVEVAPL